MEFALQDIYLESCFSKLLKNKPHMSDILQIRFAVNKDIIEICLAEIIKVFEQDIIHVLLVRGRAVGEAKEKHSVLVSSKRGDKGRVIFALGVHAELIESSDDIQPCHEFTTLYSG